MLYVRFLKCSDFEQGIVQNEATLLNGKTGRQHKQKRQQDAAPEPGRLRMLNGGRRPPRAYVVGLLYNEGQKIMLAPA